MIGRVAAALATTALAGCSLAPDYQGPAAPIPPSFPQGQAYPSLKQGELPSISYSDLFRDPRLRALIAQAFANNRDLRVAAANLAAARAQVRVTRAAQFPEVDANGSATYNRGSGMRYALQGGVSAFELDLFGRLANATAAQRERALASEADARTVRIGLVADLAKAWVTYAADRDLMAVAQDTAAAARKEVDLTRLRLEGGIAPRTDLRQAEQILDTAAQDVAQQKAALAQDENLIRLLVGASFDPALLPDGLGQIDGEFVALAPGTSSDVLLRRPDVEQAEHQLKAANADIGVARAELFPKISLTGLLGLASSALTSLFTGGAFTATAGANASYAIFDAGGRRANVAVSEAQRNAALATYEKAIQTAFREISDVLAVRGTIGDRLQAAHANTEAAADAAGLEEQRYRGGIDSFLANLDAQRSLYAARRQEVAVRAATLENLVELYRALGADIFAGQPTP
ncbi:MAG TPA: efflux transporter outer membrane subunit [Croceibacterium sp.]|jgi:multidrug efflux system outer membrane protein